MTYADDQMVLSFPGTLSIYNNQKQEAITVRPTATGNDSMLAWKNAGQWNTWYGYCKTGASTQIPVDEYTPQDHASCKNYYKEAAQIFGLAVEQV